MKTFIILFHFLPLLAWADIQTRVSKIYEIGKLQEPPLFIQTTKIQTEGAGSFISSAKIEDSKGQTVMTEKVVVRDDSLVSQFVEQLQSKQAWELTFHDNEADFKTYKITENGRYDEGGKTEKVNSFINGPLVEDFVAKHWDEFVAGKAVNTAFSVLELERTIDFKFQKTMDSERSGKKVMVVKMKPANFFISVLVDPIILEFELATKKMVYFKGRTPLKVMRSGEWKPLDAEILYY